MNLARLNREIEQQKLMTGSALWHCGPGRVVGGDGGGLRDRRQGARAALTMAGVNDGSGLAVRPKAGLGVFGRPGAGRVILEQSSG